MRTLDYKTTQKDIADQLNVSRNTVSKVFNGIPGVKEETKKRILEKAEELRYQHPLIEQHQVGNNLSTDMEALRAPTTKLYDIAFMCYQKSVNNSFWLPVIVNLERYLGKHCCNLRFVTVGEEHEQSMAVPNVLKINPPDGIVMAGLFRSEYYQSLKALNIPIVTYDITSDLYNSDRFCDIIMVENLKSTYKLTRHLIESGHVDIAFAGNKDSCQSFYERWQGYHIAMQENANTKGHEITLNFNLEGTDLCSTGYYTTEEFYDQLKGLPRLPTAFVCGNDYIAKSAFMLKEPPYKLYNDITVTGFDNTTEFISSMPKCSTTDTHTAEIGQAMGEQILWRLQNPENVWRTLRLSSTVIIK